MVCVPTLAAISCHVKARAPKSTVVAFSHAGKIISGGEHCGARCESRLMRACHFSCRPRSSRLAIRTSTPKCWVITFAFARLGVDGGGGGVSAA